MIRAFGSMSVLKPCWCCYCVYVESCRALNFVYVFKVVLKNVLALKYSRANVTMEGLDVTNIMYCGKVGF